MLLRVLYNRLGKRAQPSSALGPVVVGIVLAAGACGEASEPTSPAARTAASELGQASQVTSADPLIAYARAVPGFGGFFIDRSGVPTVYLKDTRQRAAAERALASLVREQGLAPTQLRVLKADFDYVQLDSWFRNLSPKVLALPGAVLADLDEGSNRLRVGVQDAAAAARVRSLLAQLGIPRSALIVEQRRGFRVAADLRSRVRPVKGGLQINFFVADPSPVTLVCTLGFNAVRNGVNSFVTNSHCTNVEGGVETPSSYYQPLRDPDGDRVANPENFIGTEVDDPQWWTTLTGTQCPPPFQCRYSDAARAQYASDVPFALGRIARTLARDRLLGTLTIDPSSPNLNIVAERANPVQGMEANKLGRTTGWTYGRVTETCTDVLALGTNHIRLCQSIVDAGVNSGDSGSPVFALRGGNSVTLLGILWGGSTDQENPEFVFSPMSGIERELGSLRTF